MHAGNMRQVKVKLIDSLPQREGNQPFSIRKKYSVSGTMYGFTNLTGWRITKKKTPLGVGDQTIRYMIFLNMKLWGYSKEANLFTITTSRQI